MYAHKIFFSEINIICNSSLASITIIYQKHSHKFGKYVASIFDILL